MRLSFLADRRSVVTMVARSWSAREKIRARTDCRCGPHRSSIFGSAGADRVEMEVTTEGRIPLWVEGGVPEPILEFIREACPAIGNRGPGSGEGLVQSLFPEPRKRCI